MAEPKSRKTKQSVAAFLGAIDDDARRKDCKTVSQMMKRATNAPPAMWGQNIVGFGSRPITYANGKQLDWPVIAFAPRKNDVTLYILDGSPREQALLKKLGTHTKGKSCLHIKRLTDVDLGVLEELVEDCVKAETR